MSTASLILALAIIAGQLIKIPIFGSRGIVALDLVVVALCLFASYKLKFKFKKPPLFITTASVFISVAILSLSLTPLNLSFNEYLTSFFYTVRFSMYVFLGWVILSKAFDNLRNFLPRILLFSGLSVAILGLLQFIFLPDLIFLGKSGWDPHYYRTASTFLDPNFAGAFFVLTLLTLVSLPKISHKWKVFSFILIYAALSTTFSRSSYLMFLVGFLTFSFLRKSIRLAFLSIILFLALLLSFKIYLPAVNRVTPLDRNDTVSLRFTTWQQGFEIFQKSPVIGIGFNAYNFALKKYSLGTEQFLEGRGSTANDSSLLHILVTTGILGFIAFFIFLFGLIKTAGLKNPALIAGIAGLLAHSFFVNSLFYPFILIWIILSAASVYAKKSSE